MIYSRKTQPTEPFTDRRNNSNHVFRVWANNPSYEEDPRPWKLLASFCRATGSQWEHQALYYTQSGKTRTLK
jgi:hypothetical protein